MTANLLPPWHGKEEKPNPNRHIVWEDDKGKRYCDTSLTKIGYEKFWNAWVKDGHLVLWCYLDDLIALSSRPTGDVQILIDGLDMIEDEGNRYVTDVRYAAIAKRQKELFEASKGKAVGDKGEVERLKKENDEIAIKWHLSSDEARKKMAALHQRIKTLEEALTKYCNELHPCVRCIYANKVSGCGKETDCICIKGFEALETALEGKEGAECKS